MKKFVFVASLMVLVVSLFTLALPALALVGSEAGPYLGLEYGQYTGLGNQDIRFTAARIISVALGLLGMIATVLIIYAGFKLMTAGGNEENAASARKILFAAVIGLIIILSAYSLTSFVMTNLFQATTGYTYQNLQD